MAVLPDVVLVTLDTTRADALSCYGVPPGPYERETRTTPVVDALAAEGVRFERFFAHAPSTLSSHASLMTGEDPHGHAVVRNGFPLDPSVPTLAERLRDAGWDPIAAVGASVLERAMGLDRGFRVYEDGEGDLVGLVQQLPADAVVANALAAVDARPEPERPLFLWVHLYDAHGPYTPPDAFARRFTPRGEGGAADGATIARLAADLDAADPAEIERVNGLYLAEVAFADAQVGVLLDGLRARGREPGLVVVAADHGETLADDPVYAWSHGSDVGFEVMRVPLVIRGPGVAEGAVVERQAAMSGLAPTIERLVGLEPTLGRDFAALVRPGPVDDTDGWPDRPTIPAFLEATRPRYAENERSWNNLDLHRAVVAGGWAVELAPFLGTDWTFQAHGRPADEAVLSTLAALLDRWDADAPPHREPSAAPSTTEALRALGYSE